MIRADVLYDAMREGLWVAVIASAPILSVALFVGLLIGLLQALTSIQEMTLTFVPKLAAIVGVFWLSMGFMTNSVVGFFRDSIVPIVAGL